MLPLGRNKDLLEMQTKKIELEIPSDLSLAMNESEQEIKDHLKLALAFMLYQQEKLTIGKAAQLAGLLRYEFELALSKNKIPISNLSINDIESDIQKLQGI